MNPPKPPINKPVSLSKHEDLVDTAMEPSQADGRLSYVEIKEQQFLPAGGITSGNLAFHFFLWSEKAIEK